MWPFGPFCAMFGVSKISIRSRCIGAGFVGGQNAAGPGAGAAGSGSSPAVAGAGAGGSGRALRSRAPAPQPPARARGRLRVRHVVARNERKGWVPGDEMRRRWRRQIPRFAGSTAGRARAERGTTREERRRRDARDSCASPDATGRRLPHAPDREKIRARVVERRKSSANWCRRTAAYGHPRRHAARTSAHRFDVRHVR